jgi:hypothetical protein
MTIIGFDFTKMHIERRKVIKGKMNISNNVLVRNVEDVKMSFGPGKVGLKFGFQFTTKYEPDVGDILIEGEILYLATEEEAKTIIAGWKKDKKIAKDVRLPLLNHVLAKSTIQAVILSKEMALPPPIILPHVNDDIEEQQPKETKKKAG